MPLLRYAHARANVVAYPIPAVSVARGGEDVEADFEPVVEAVSDLNSLVHGVMRGRDTVDGVLLAFHGEVGMKLDHSVVRFERLGRVDLDLVVVLGEGGD